MEKEEGEEEEEVEEEEEEEEDSTDRRGVRISRGYRKGQRASTGSVRLFITWNRRGKDTADLHPDFRVHSRHSVLISQLHSVSKPGNG